LRFLGFVAACTVAALTACSSGGSTGVTPSGQQSMASTLSSTTVSSVGRSSSDNGDCQTGGRHENSVARTALDHEGHDGGDKTSSSCCPTTGAGATPTPAPVTGTRDHARSDVGGDNQDQGNSSCCPTTITGGSGTPGTPGTRDRARRSDDGGSSSCHVPGPLTVTPSTVAIDCNVASTASFTVAGNPAGLTATAVDTSVATVGPLVSVGGSSGFVVTGIAGFSTTVKLTDTAGDTGSVYVTVVNCPKIGR
jgi:hypothetical protein